MKYQGVKFKHPQMIGDKIQILKLHPKSNEKKSFFFSFFFFSKKQMRRYLTRFATIFLSCDQVLYNLSSLILNLAFTKHKNYYQIKANGNPSTSRPYLGIPLLFWSKFSFPLSLSLSLWVFLFSIYLCSSTFSLWSIIVFLCN